MVEKTMKAGSSSVCWMNRTGTAVSVLGVKLLLSQMHKLNHKDISDMSKFSQDVSCWIDVWPWVISQLCTKTTSRARHLGRPGRGLLGQRRHLGGMGVSNPPSFPSVVIGFYLSLVFSLNPKNSK